MDLFGGGSGRTPNLQTMKIDPNDPSLLPTLRIFVSHRWQDKSEFHKRILRSFHDCRTRIHDLSLTMKDGISGPRGGRTPNLRIQMEIAKRVRACDLFFVPADIAAASDPWIEYETHRAAEHRKPSVFVSTNWRRMRWNKYAEQLSKEGLQTCKANLDSRDILEAVRTLLPGRLH